VLSSAVSLIGGSAALMVDNGYIRIGADADVR
jgi:hypothetical protein